MHKSIDDFCCLKRHFNRVRAGEVNFSGFVVAVGATVSNVFHRVEDFFDFRLKFQCLNFLPQPRITLVTIDFFQFCNRVTQSLKTDTQKGTCRSWGKIGDALSFHKNFLNGLRHVFAGVDSERLRIDQLGIFPNGHFVARRTDGDMDSVSNLVARIVSCLVFSYAFPEKEMPEIHGSRAAEGLQRGPAHLTGDMAMRASEV
mgnify:CR=1 FL=1